MKLSYTNAALIACIVAPFVGAWIEIYPVHTNLPYTGVAPFVGAWIEILDDEQMAIVKKSHPSWVRGLK